MLSDLDFRIWSGRISRILVGTPMKINWKNLTQVSPLKISILIIGLAIALYISNFDFFRFMELKSLDVRMLSRGSRATCGQVVIATVDEKSLNELGRWPWPRSYLGKLLETLKGFGAKAVGFDIVFAEPDENSGLTEIKDLSRELSSQGISNPVK